MQNAVRGLLLCLALSACCRADLTLRYTVNVKAGNAVPPAIAKALEQQLATHSPEERTLRMKGDKALSKTGKLTMIMDNPTSSITLLSPATKQYAQLSKDEYVNGLRAEIPPEMTAMLKNMKFDVQTTRTGQFGMVSGIRAEERLTTMTVSMDAPGVPQSSAARIEMRTWLATADEMNRLPALRQYAAAAQRALNVSAADNAMEKLFGQAPGVAEKMRMLAEEAASNAGSLTVKTAMAIYDPKDGSNTPVLTTTTELAEISSDAIDDSLFAVPPGFQLVPAAQLMKASAPGPAAATAPANPVPGNPVSIVRRGVVPPVVLYKRDPEYTEEARRAKLQGAVLLKLVVDKDGAPTNVEIAQSLGLGLDEKAIEAVRQWKFRPGQKDGQPVNVRVTVQVNFRLVDRPPQQ